MKAFLTLLFFVDIIYILYFTEKDHWKEGGR